MLSHREASLSAKRITHFQQLPGYVIPESISAKDSEDILIQQVITPRKIRINNKALPFFVDNQYEHKSYINNDKLKEKMNRSRMNCQEMNGNSTEKIKKHGINCNN